MGRKDKSEIRKPEILEHLYEVLAKDGLEGASLAKVANHMGVYPSMLVHYFKTKEQMMVEFVDYIIERFNTWYMSDIDNITDPKKRFDLMLDRIFMLKGQGVIDPVVFYAIVYLSFRSTRVKKRVQAMYSLLIESLRSEINVGVKQGILNCTDVEMISFIITIVTEGLDYCRFMYDDLKAIEKAGLFLKSAILNVLKNGFGDSRFIDP